MQAKEDASEFLQEKIALEKEKKALHDSAAEKDAQLKAKIGTIGYVREGPCTSVSLVLMRCK